MIKNIIIFLSVFFIISEISGDQSAQPGSDTEDSTELKLIYGLHKGIHNFELGERIGLSGLVSVYGDQRGGTGVGSQLLFLRNTEVFGAGFSHRTGNWKFLTEFRGNLKETDSGGGFDRDFFLYPGSQENVPGLDVNTGKMRDSPYVWGTDNFTWSFVNADSSLRYYAADAAAEYSLWKGLFIYSGAEYQKYMLYITDGNGWTIGHPVYYPGRILTLDSEIWRIRAGAGFQTDPQLLVSVKLSASVMAGYHRFADYHHLRGWRDSIMNSGNGYLLNAEGTVRLFRGTSIALLYYRDSWYSYTYSGRSERTPGNNEYDVIYYLAVGGRGSGKWVTLRDQGLLWSLSCEI